MTDEYDPDSQVQVVERFHTTRENTEMFADITGDDNPLHVDDEAAEDGFFGEPVVHGVHGLGYVSATIANMPVDGDVILTDIQAQFVKPIHHGETVVVSAYYHTPDPEIVTFAVWPDEKFENGSATDGPPYIGGKAEIVVK